MAGGVATAFSVTSASALFKNKYEMKSEETYNNATPLLTRIKKEQDFVGKQMDIAVPLSFNGGVGSGKTLPTANTANYGDAVLTRKTLSSRILLDREAIKASANEEGAIVRATKEQVAKGVESFTRNLSRTLFATTNGALGHGDNATNVTGAGTSIAPYTFVVSAATWVQGFWEQGDFVSVGTDTTLVEIVTVAPSTKTISVVGTSAALAALSTTGGSSSPLNVNVFMQNSSGNDPQSLYAALTATSSTLYGLSVGYRWQAYQNTAGGPFTPDLINDLVLGVEFQCGKPPNLIVTSYKQYKKLMNQLEDQKRYPIEGRTGKLKGEVLFEGIEVMTSAGPVPVVPERMCPDDTCMALNDNYLTYYSTPGSPAWVDEDGSVFFRVATADQFECRYVAYLELWAPPSFHGIATGLT